MYELAISIAFDRRHLLLDIFPRHLRTSRNSLRGRENPVAFHANDGKMEKILGSRTERIEGEGSESAHLLLLLLLDRSIDKIENARGLLPVLMNERLVDAA